MKESIFTSYDELPFFLNAEVVSKELGVSFSSAYELMNERNFSSVRIGNRLMIAKENLLNGSIQKQKDRVVE